MCLDRDSRQACHLRLPSENNNISTTCTVLAPFIRTLCVLCSMEDIGNISIHRCHLMTLLSTTSSWFIILNSGFWSQAERYWLCDLWGPIRSWEPVILQLPLMLEGNICPLQSKRPNWIQIDKNLMRSSKKLERENTLKRLKSNNVNVESLVNGVHGKPAAVLKQWPCMNTRFSFSGGSPLCNHVPLSCWTPKTMLLLDFITNYNLCAKWQLFQLLFISVLWNDPKFSLCIIWYSSVVFQFCL